MSEIINDGLEEKGKQEFHPDIKSASEDVIGDVTTLREGQILLPEFAEIIGVDLFINLDKILNKEVFIDFVNNVFKNDCYFNNLDYEIFKKIIYDLDDVKKSLENKKIRLSGIIKKFLPDRKLKYQNPKIHGKDSAEYSFCKLYDNIEVEGKTIEKEVLLDVDEFIASMWNYGIHYGLDIIKISDIIKNQKSDRIIIAKYLEPIHGIDAKLLTMVNLGIDPELQTKTGGFINLKNYKRVFPQIKAGTKIYQKINKTPGYNGMNILGEEVLPPIPKDIILEDIIEEIDSGVKIVEELGIKFIVSQIDGYVTPLQGNYDSKSFGEDEKHLVEITTDQIKGKLKITKEIDLGIIGPDTGDISTFGDIKAKGLLNGYSIQANKVEVAGDIYGSILSISDINILGNITGGQQNKVISSEGNISVKGNIFLNSYIQTLKGLIDLQNIETSIIIGKKIKVKNVRKTIFIGEDIEVEGTCSDCIFILINCININTLQIKQNSENMIFVIEPPNFEQEIEDCSNKIAELTDKKNKIELTITKFKEVNKQIINNKRVQEYLKIVKKVKEKAGLTKEEIDTYKSDMLWYNQELAKYKSNLDNQKKLEELFPSILKELESLDEQFQKLGELSSKQVIPKVDVKINKGDLKIYSLDFKPYKSIEYFSIEDLKILTDMKIFLSQKYFKYVLKDTFSSGSISWEYKGNKKI